MDTHAQRKERGAFFTPPEITSFIVDWAVRGPGERVLEPSCGEASFLLPAAHRLEALGRIPTLAQIRGVDLHEPSARTARSLLRRAGYPASITTLDFFDLEPDPSFSAVIGNPPYIRYQNFSGDLRAKALRAALSQGVRLTRLASSWAAFVVHASRFLAPGGRLGLVLPAELLTVNYAAPVRRFLLKRFGQVRLVLFEDLVFPGVLEEVVLLLAEGEGPARHFAVYQAHDLDDLRFLEANRWSGFAPENEDKWTPALLSAEALSEYRSLIDAGAFVDLLHWGDTYLGAVTGCNRFFALTGEDVCRLRIPEGDLLRISPPGSRHLRELSFTTKAWEAASGEGSRCHLFYPASERLNAASRRYVEQGERDAVHKAYKCRVRTPWWRVPLVPRPDLLLTYMDHERPRLVCNGAGVRHLNSLYGVMLRPRLRGLGRDLLPISALNSLTLLGSEIVGRSYGGGLLKLEPKEADRMPVPSPSLTRAVASQLRAVRPELVKLLRQGELAQAVERIDHVVLRGQLGLNPSRLATLRRAREILFARRALRGKGSRDNGR